VLGRPFQEKLFPAEQAQIVRAFLEASRRRHQASGGGTGENGPMTLATHITVQVPLSIRRRRGRKTIITPHGAPAFEPSPTPRRADPAMLKALARAFRWKRMLDTGRYASVSEIATKEMIDRGYVGSILRLTLLAPDIIEAILNGQATGLNLPRLLEPFPLEWDAQRTALLG
jgi:hypothetical protein